MNSRGAFWFCVYQGALNAELFIELLQQMMKGRKKPVHLVLDSLPAHKKTNVREYVQSTEGKLSLHFLPGYAPDLNPDELVWSHGVGALQTSISAIAGVRMRRVWSGDSPQSNLATRVRQGELGPNKGRRKWRAFENCPDRDWI